MSPAAAAAGGGERRRPIASGRDCRGRGCGGATGAALVGLSLLGLVLYLVPAVAALAWLAVGATAAWWGLSAEPRGSRAFSLGRHARRPRAPLASTSAKAAANGNLLEPRSLLEGPDRAELLLMGSYLGKPGPPPPAAAAEARELRERPGRRPPARTSPPSPPAYRTHHLPLTRPAPLASARRPSPRDCGTLSNRFIITPRRHYPIQQAQYSLLGVLPTVCWNGYHKKTVLSPRNSKMVCSPVTVRIAPPDSKLARSSLPEQAVSSPLSSPPSSTPDPCAKETVLNALRERKKRSVEEDDQIFTSGQENKRRRHDSSGSGHSAFEPLVANGVPAAFVPKPGSLKRGLMAQSTDDYLNKRSRTSSLSSLASTCTGGIPSSGRNAIASSYSSTRGHTQLWKRTGPSSSPFSSPASSRSQTPERPAKKMREEELTQPSSSAPLVTDKESRGEKVADAAVPRKQNSFSSPATPGGSGQRKRKIQLLPSRRGDQLTLPPPPQLGYSVTAEDLDLEKKASLQWFNKVLEDPTDAASGPVPENPPAPPVTFSLTLPVTEAAPLAAPSVAPLAPLPEPSANPSPLLESLKKMRGSPGLLPALGTATVATSEAPTSPKTPSLLAPLAAPPPAPLPGISEDSKPSVTFLGLTPTSSTIPITETTKAPVASQAETAAPAPAPKQSILFGMLSTPTSSAPASAAGVSPAASTFKPIFETPPKSEVGVSLPTKPSKVSTASPVAPAASSSSAPPTATTSSASTFKPIFDSLGQPPSVPLLPPFSFVPTPAATTNTNTTNSAPLFTGQASTTSSAATVATASTTAATATKPVFGFTVGAVTSTGNSSSSSTTATATVVTSSQPFLFGTPPTSTASFPPALSSVFQFGQTPAVPPATTAATFGQSLSSAAPSSGTSSFTGFGSALSTAPATSSAASTTFNIPFGSGTKAPLPSYPAANPPPTFGATDGPTQGAAKPALAPSFGSSFTFGNSAAPAPTAAPAPAPAPTPAQPTFDSSTTQYTFGGLKPTASAFGTCTTTQPAFGGTTSVFSFGAATTQTPSSGASTSLFGSSTTPSLFTFGGSASPAAGGGFGLSAASTSSTSGAFSFGTGQSGSAAGTTPFGAGLSQNPLAVPSQSAPFAFSVPSTPENKPVFGGTSTFGQNNPGPGVGATGSSLPFGASSTPAQGFVGVGPFGSAAPSFSIGAGSKTPGARQRLQARRQHTRKK